METIDRDSGVESELIDLGSVPLTELRLRDDVALHRAVRHVVEETTGMAPATRSGCQSPDWIG